MRPNEKRIASDLSVGADAPKSRDRDIQLQVLFSSLIELDRTAHDMGPGGGLFLVVKQSIGENMSITKYHQK